MMEYFPLEEEPMLLLKLKATVLPEFLFYKFSKNDAFIIS